MLSKEKNEVDGHIPEQDRANRIGRNILGVGIFCIAVLGALFFFLYTGIKAGESIEPPPEVDTSRNTSDMQTSQTSTAEDEKNAILHALRGESSASIVTEADKYEILKTLQNQ